MTTISHEDYYSYLTQRSLMGHVYRRYFLYPRLARQIKGTVLDVGCGIGDFINYYKDSAGLDVNPLNVEHCQRRGLVAHLIEGERYPVNDASYDSAMLDNVLEHLVEPRLVLNEIHRVLKPDGTLLVGVPGIRGFASDADHKRFYNESALISCLTDCHYSVKKILHVPYKSDWLDRKMRQYCIYGVFKREMKRP